MFTSHILSLPTARVQRALASVVFILLSVFVLQAQTDIAVMKTVNTTTADIGDQITFTIDVVNEGTVALTGVEVTDVIPSNTTFVSSGGDGVYDSGTGLWTIGSIAGGITSSFTVTLDVTGEGVIYNVAEVTALDQVDDDSTPANGNYNEDDISSACISVPVRMCPSIMDTIEASVPVTGLTNIQWFRDTGSGPVLFGSGSPIDIVAGGSYTFTADNTVGCEAGNCCPLVIEEFCFDLALTSVMTTTGAIAPGDNVTFEIEITNQGNQPAYAIDVTDYIPTDMNFDPTNAINLANGWVLVGANPTSTIDGPLAAGLSITLVLVLEVDATFMSTLMVNKVEISAADNDLDTSNTPPTDIDSTPDLDSTNDAGGFAGTASDDVINGDGTGMPNDTNSATDEDDADPALITVTQTYDLSLTKGVTSAGPFIPGSLVTYEITVSNDGTQDATNIEVTDILPSGMTFVNGVDFTTIAPFTSTIASLPAGGAPVVLTLDARIDASFQGTSLTNVAEITVDDGVDADSDPGNDDLTEDDQEEVSITVDQTFDLALRKSRLSTEYLTADGDIIFEIKVFNQGTLTASNIEVFDYIPTGFSLSPNDTNSWFLSGTNGYNTIAGPLLSGDSMSFEIVLRADSDIAQGTYTNRAEIIGSEDAAGNDMTNSDIDSVADSDDTNDIEVNDTITDDGTLDEDDADFETFAVEIFDLALQKTVTGSDEIKEGEDISFTVTIYNQGTLDATNIEVTDFLPSGFVLSTANTESWIMSGANASITIPSLTGGMLTTVEIILTATTATAGDFENIVEISSAQDDSGVFIADIDSISDLDSTNDNFIDDELNDNGAIDEDDNDRASFTISPVDMVDLALQKTVSGSTLFTIGDEVTFSFEIFNQGNVPVYNVLVTDYLPANLVLSANDMNNWTSSGTYLESVLAGPIAPGTSATMSLLLMVDSGSPAGSVTNIAEITDFEDALGSSIANQDIDSQVDDNPGNDLIQDDQIFDLGTTDEDDHDIALINIEIVDIALIKRISPSQVMPIEIGDDVLFEIELFNQGSVDLTNIEVVDYFAQGMNISTNDMNGWTGSGSSISTQTYTGNLVAGASQILEILVAIDATINQTGDINVAEIQSFTDVSGVDRSDDDIDSTSDADVTNDGDMTDDEIFNANDDEDDSDFAAITIDICEDVSVSPDASICFGESVQLEATHSEVGVVYAWTPSVGLSCADCANPIATSSTTVNYEVTATYNSCTSSAMVTVNVITPLSIDEVIDNLTCCTGGVITLGVMGGSGSYLTTWSDNTLSGLTVTDLDAGDYTVTITDDSNCSITDTYTIIDDCNCSDLVAQDQITLSTTDASEICLPFTFEESQNTYDVLLDGAGIVQPIDGCDIDSVFSYSYSNVVDQGNSGPYMLDLWTSANGQIYSGVEFQNMNELVDSMNVWDLLGNWVDIPSGMNISGGLEGATYGNMTVTHIASQVSEEINILTTGVANGQVYDVPDAPGSYQYTITNTQNCCSDMLTVVVEAPAGPTPDYTSYFTEVNNPIFLCVNLEELSTTPLSLAFCEDPDNGQVFFDIGNECMTYIPDPNYVGLDSFCIVVCDESGICDTTFVDITISNDPHTLTDTITYTTGQNTSTGFQCMPWQKFFSTGFDTLIVCGEPVNGTLFSDGDNECIEYIPDTDFCGRDSMCIITCSDLNVCGTITIFIDVTCEDPMPTPDTVYVSVLVNTILEDACVPLDELNGVFDTLYLCGSASNGAVVPNTTDHCVDYTPDLNYLGPDEFCVVICDPLMFCDTTYFIIDVVGSPCDSTSVESVSLESEDCEDSAVLCLPYDITDLSDYLVTLGGDQYMNNFVGCDFDTSFSYNYFLIPGQGGSGPYVLNQWIVDGQAFSGNFLDVSDLVSLMNSFDTSSTWSLDAANYRIQGGNSNTDYGNMDITQPLSGGTAELQFNENLVANKAGLLLPVGIHDVRLTHTSGCPIYQYNVLVECTPIFVDTIPYILEVNDTLIVCPSDLGITDLITGVFNNCPTSAGIETSVSVDAATGCITIIGLEIGDSEQACIEVCTADSCSQFVLLLEVVPSCGAIFSMDTMILVTNNCDITQEVCLNVPFTDIDNYTIELDGAAYTGSIDACANGTAINMLPGEYQLLVTDTINNCFSDTELIIACITPDTIYSIIDQFETDSVCIDLNELVGAPVSIDNFCEDISGEFVVFDVTNSTFCLSYLGVETGIDTACIVVCDDLNICDTTYVIIKVISALGTPPVAVDDMDTTPINTEININIVINDTIPGGIDTLYISNDPLNGVVTLNPDNTVSYFPNVDYCDSNVPDEFTYVLCNEFGCDSAVVQVFVLCEDVTFYAGFSPNGDGVNETFIVKGIENFPNNKLSIFNRWGNQVLYTNNYQNDWDGTWENALLPDGTYFYVLDNGEGEIYSGYIQINR